MKWLQFQWRCCKRSWTVSGPDLRNACVETEAILRALLSKHKFSNWHKTKWLFICFSFMTNKQIKNPCVIFFNILKFFRFIAQPCIYQSAINPQLLLSIQQTLMDQILGLDYFVNEISVWQKNIKDCDTNCEKNLHFCPIHFHKITTATGRQPNCS